jgi:hypothetical protein
MSDHDERYTYPEPVSIAEAKLRKRELERDIMNIERQLSDRDRRGRDGSLLTKEAYLRWYKGARSSLIFKRVEHTYLKDWILERRRQLQARELDIYELSDPRALLLQCRQTLREVLDGRDPEDTDAGNLYNVIEQYLHHAA